MKRENEKNNRGYEELKENIMEARREVCIETKGIRRKEERRGGGME